MSEKISDRERLPNETYEFGFHDDVESVYEMKRGISEKVVREISFIKNEPEWMLDIRLKAYQHFVDSPMPQWGADLSDIDFSEYIYYLRASQKSETLWEDVPEAIRNTFERLGIPEAEDKYLSGVATQYDSEMVYSSMLKEVESKGVLFFDMDTGLREYPEIVQKYFGQLVSYNDNKFAALNTAVWSGGSFVYIPKGVTLDKPLQSYFRFNTEQMGQF